MLQYDFDMKDIRLCNVADQGERVNEHNIYKYSKEKNSHMHRCAYTHDTLSWSTKIKKVMCIQKATNTQSIKSVLQDTSL